MTNTHVDLVAYSSLKLTLSCSFHLLLCARDIMCVYHATYSLKLCHSDNKHELIQVVVNAYVTIHKNPISLLI